MYRFQVVSMIICCVGLQVSIHSSHTNGQDKGKGDNPYADKMLNVLSEKKVQKDLELVPEQKRKLDEIMQKVQQERKLLGEELKEFSGNASPEEVEKFKAEVLASFEESKIGYLKSVRRVLLPHQQERLGQLAVQMMIRETSKKYPVSVLAPEMKEYLGIDDKQAKEIEKKAIEVRKRLDADIKELIEKAKTELMDQMTDEQQKKYRKLVGEPIEK